MVFTILFLYSLIINCQFLRSVGVLALASVAPEVRPITGEQSSEFNYQLSIVNCQLPIELYTTSIIFLPISSASAMV